MTNVPSIICSWLFLLMPLLLQIFFSRKKLSSRLMVKV